MCQKIFVESELTEENYNLIVSNVILSQTKEFTYCDIIDYLKTFFDDVTEKLKLVVRNCLLRLRDDGFLKIFGCNYSVVDSVI